MSSVGWRNKRISTGWALAIAVICIGGLVMLNGLAGRSQTTSGLKKQAHRIEVQSERLHAYQLSGCERGKADRVGDARTFLQLANYYQGILAAASVKRDVKVRATKARHNLIGSARAKLSRVFVCKLAVDKGKLKLDMELINTLGSRELAMIGKIPAPRASRPR